jgi:ribosomal protein S18 acetylase RimI-like enzyme
MVTFTELRREHAAEVVDLWNEAVAAQGQGYEQHTLTTSRLQAIMGDPNHLPSGALVAQDEGELIGFAVGYVQTVDFRGEGDLGGKPGRLAGVAVKPSRWRKGIGRALLCEVENVLARRGKSAVSFETYRMPFHLAPRFYLDSGPYRFMVSCGYHPKDHALCFRNELDAFALSDDIKRRRERLASEGIEVRWYAPQDRSDLQSFMKRCFPGGWFTAIKNATESPRPAKILVAVARGRIVGFMGQFWPPDASGRGGFGSPGVDPEFRGRGLGTVIFHLGLEYLKSAGARSTDYSTGVTNAARFMYFKSGAKLTAIACSNFHKALRK